MAKGNSVTVRIDGDSSGLKKELSNIKNTAAAGLADIKAGIDLTAAATRKLFDVASKGINYNATIEQLKTSFEVMTGSAEKAAEVVDRLRVMGAETPFEMVDLASTTQLLMQYGFTADEAIDRMRMLGDIAQGNANAMNSIALGYAQMSSAGKVNLVDIKQMITAGFNPLQEISERTGESMASLYDRISKGTMTVDEITESMRHATSEGGKFFQSMEKQSQTLNGQLSTLKDNADQLLGSLTEGLSEGLRTELLPLASNLVAELQTAFDTGGYQGLVDKATGMLPDLLNMMTGELQKAITGLSRWLPQGATQLMKALPTALRGASAVVPEITTALFEVATQVTGNLIEMLPELAPLVIEGIGNTLASVALGASKLLGTTMMEIFDLLGIELDKGFNGLADLVDEERLLEISGAVDGKFDTTGLDAAEANLVERIGTLRNNIQTALTDGLPDTEEVTLPLKKDVIELENDLLADIDEWEAHQIQLLDPNAPDFTTACQNIRQEATLAKEQVTTLADELLTYIDEMTGKPTEYVKENVAALDAAIAEMDTLAKKYGAAVEEFSKEAQAFRAVKAGASKDKATIDLSVDYAVAKYKLDAQSVQDSHDEAVAQIISDFNSGKITQEESIKLQEEAEVTFKTDMDAIDAEYRKNAQAIVQGIAKTFTPEEMQSLFEYSEIKSLDDVLQQTISEIFAGNMSPLEIPESVTSALMERFGGLQIGVILGEAIQKGVATPELISAILAVEEETNQAAEDAAKAADFDILGTIWAALTEGTGGGEMENVLSGFSLESALSTPINSAVESAETAMSGSQADLTTAAETAVEGVPGAMDKSVEAETSGLATSEGLALGIRNGMSKVIAASISVANAAILAMKTKLGIASPSKVMMELGQFSGEGYAIGLQQSMENAVLIARRMTGEIATAAQISMPMQVRVPDMQQSIEYALEATQQPVNLYVNGRELARVTASDTQQAQNWHNRRIALGVGK